LKRLKWLGLELLAQRVGGHDYDGTERSCVRQGADEVERVYDGLRKETRLQMLLKKVGLD
jgi:hypothetical protein